MISMHSLSLKSQGLHFRKPSHPPRVLVNHRSIQHVSFRTRASLVEGKTNKPHYPYAEGPVIVDGQIAHSMSRERFEIVNSLNDFLKQDVNTFRSVKFCNHSYSGVEVLEANWQDLATSWFPPSARIRKLHRWSTHLLSFSWSIMIGE